MSSLLLYVYIFFNKIIQDTKGPEIRTGFTEGHKPVVLEAGQELEIHVDYSLLGNKERITCNYSKLPQTVKPGTRILIADGLFHELVFFFFLKKKLIYYQSIYLVLKSQIIVLLKKKKNLGSLILKVLECHNTFVKTEALNNFVLGERKNMNLPDTIIDLPTLTVCWYLYVQITSALFIFSLRLFHFLSFDVPIDNFIFFPSLLL